MRQTTKELIATLQTKELFTNTMYLIVSMKEPSIPAEARLRFATELIGNPAVIGAMNSAIAEFFEEQFVEDEIKELTTINRLPVMRKMAGLHLELQQCLLQAEAKMIEGADWYAAARRFYDQEGTIVPN